MAWVGRFDDFADHAGNFCELWMAKPQHFNSTKQSFKTDNLPRHEENNPLPSHQLLPDGSAFTPIANISNHVQCVSITGVVIAREGPRSIISKKGSGQERHLMCLTVRDGPMSFINVTCWGSMEYVNFLHSKTAIGEVIEIKGAQVQEKSNPNDEKFKPWTPSSCQLTVSETNGCVSPFTGDQLDMFIKLLHIPTRDNNDYYSLEDIQTNGINIQGQHVNILAIVKKIWPVKQITTKTGKKTSKVDVVLCDETCLAFNLTLWDSFVEFAERWHPMETVIYASDVKIVYNDFRSSMAANSDSKTIFTTDPDIPEGHRLLNFATTQNTFMSDDVNHETTEDNKDPDLNSITNILTVQEAKVLQSEVSSYNGKTSYGILNSYLSHFDLDGDDKSCIRYVCPNCHKTVQDSTGFVCSNIACSGGDTPFEKHTEYSITVSFSDHTGTLEHCHLWNNVAEQLLGCKADEFSNLATPEKTGMKWNYLLEKTKATIKIRKGSGKSDRAFVSILALEKLSN